MRGKELDPEIANLRRALRCNSDQHYRSDRMAHSKFYWDFNHNSEREFCDEFEDILESFDIQFEREYIIGDSQKRVDFAINTEYNPPHSIIEIKTNCEDYARAIGQLILYRTMIRTKHGCVTGRHDVNPVMFFVAPQIPDSVIRACGLVGIQTISVYPGFVQTGPFLLDLDESPPRCNEEYLNWEERDAVKRFLSELRRGVAGSEQQISRITEVVKDYSDHVYRSMTKGGNNARTATEIPRVSH